MKIYTEIDVGLNNIMELYEGIPIEESAIPKSYIMFHCHSDYSLLDSCTKYTDYVKLSVQNGSKALSISEHGKPLNWTEKWAACKEAGIRYIHSVEIYLTEQLEPKVRDNYHTVLMARNMAGVLELNSLVSKSCDEEHFYYTNRISFDEFLNLSDNIISTSACLASPLNKLPEDHPRYDELVKKYNFLEVQPHLHEDQVSYNKRLLHLSKKYNIPLIAGTDTHNSTPYKAECRSMLMAAKRKTYGDEDRFDLTYKTYDELVDMFKAQGALPEDEYITAIDNTNLLYDMTEDLELDVTIKYPILYGTREADSKAFVDTINRKFEEKIKNGIIPSCQIDAFKEAIAEELRVFQKLHMDGFMLSMSELISWCKEQHMAIGPARGSVGGSRIAYITDIIDLNPETWHTVFSRFCNEDREEIGDVDIDCIEADRPKIFEYIVGRFGTEKTARVASFMTLKEKAVIDEVGRALYFNWKKENEDVNEKECPWSIPNIARIKKEYDSDPNRTAEKYPEIFYYMDGMLDVKISQSVHPAGMVISPISLTDNYGAFKKDNDICLMLDMENVHDYTGLAKYDFLILKTVQVINDTCKYIGIPYPKSHEVDWNDAEVWSDMTRSPAAIFQFESVFAFECLRKFRPRNIFDMSLVTACIRPTGASYRDDLLARKQHKNPSDVIDKLLENNLGYLVYQEDTIAFLQQVCGLSGSEADNIRRAIGRKQKDRLDKAMPSILDGYCSKSSKPREEAEDEAKEFLQVIEDSASYQFGYNHSIAYCLLGYLCAYYRHYYPLEFLTSYLNNAANDNDIKVGSEYASKVGIKVTMPKWGASKSTYFYDKDNMVIAKGLSSVKYIGNSVAEELYSLAHSKHYKHFVDVLRDICKETSLDSRQTEILIKIDFFSAFGNQRELLRIYDIFHTTFKDGDAKEIKKASVSGSPMEEYIQKYSNGLTKKGEPSKSYKMNDVMQILREIEERILSVHMEDLEDRVKIENFNDVMGYYGYSSGKEEDRPRLYVCNVYPLFRKKDNAQFGYSVITRSIGSGKEARFTVFNSTFNNDPIDKGDIINCKRYRRDGPYFTLQSYEHVM